MHKYSNFTKDTHTTRFVALLDNYIKTIRARDKQYKLSDYYYYYGTGSEYELAFELYYGKAKGLYEIEILGGNNDRFVKYTAYRQDNMDICKSYYLIWLVKYLDNHKVPYYTKYDILQVEVLNFMQISIKVVMEGRVMSFIVYNNDDAKAHFGTIHLMAVDGNNIDDYLEGEESSVRNGNEQLFSFVLDEGNNDCLSDRIRYELNIISNPSERP